MFDDFLEMIYDNNSFVGTRGFLPICAQAIRDMDEKPTVVCQCFAALHEVILYRPELTLKIQEAALAIDANRYIRIVWHH